MALDYYEASLFETVPILYTEIASALDAEYHASDPNALPTEITSLPIVVRFGSWIGGDRDGNPFVTAATTDEALSMSRDLLRDQYLQQLRDLFDQRAHLTCAATATR